MITIIIPVFNSERFLRRCLDSIVNQSYREFEVILVDDGSKDKSGAICDEYVYKDDRFKVFHNTNGGPSVARNFGLEHSSGDYILFIDSDDILEPNALATYSYTVSKHRPDIIKSGYEIDYPDNKKRVYSVSNDIIATNSTQMFIEAENAGYSGFLWNTLLSREVIGNIRFDESLKWLEDHLFSFEVFSHCKKMVLLPTITYHYMADQSESLSNVKDAWMVYYAGNKEYEVKSKLVGNDSIARELNFNSYIGKMSMAVDVLYQNYPYDERKRFRQSARLFPNAEFKDKQSKLFYSNLPMIIADRLILFYRLLRKGKRNLRKYLKKILYD